MHTQSSLYRLLLILSGVGIVFALLAMFTSLPFLPFAVITILCYLIGAAVVLFALPKPYRQEDRKKKFPFSVRSVILAYWTAALLTVFILPYVALVHDRMLFAEILVAFSYVFSWGFLFTQVRNATKKKKD